jgi:hypothetical protein
MNPLSNQQINEIEVNNPLIISKMNTENQNKIDLKSLSPEALKELKAAVAAEEKQKKEFKKQNVDTFKKLGHEFLEKHIDGLVNRQLDIEKSVVSLFKEISQYLELKAEIYGLEKLDQESHTITHEDGSSSITIGYNPSIKFDGSETAGVQKIMNYITALSGDEHDENSQKLAKAVKFFLKPNYKTGMLNPGRIIQLNQMRSDFNSPEFDEGMDIIVEAQNKVKGSSYVSGFKNIDMGDGRVRKLEFRFTV